MARSSAFWNVTKAQHLVLFGTGAYVVTQYYIEYPPHLTFRSRRPVVQHLALQGASRRHLASPRPSKKFKGGDRRPTSNHPPADGSAVNDPEGVWYYAFYLGDMVGHGNLGSGVITDDTRDEMQATTLGILESNKVARDERDQMASLR